MAFTDIGSCNLHIVHNAFKKGLDAFTSSNSEFVIDLHSWFKLSAARREDYEDVQEQMSLPKHKFLKHVESRWLTLLPAIIRILEQIKGLKKYFLDDLPSKEPTIATKPRYFSIRRHLQ